MMHMDMGKKVIWLNCREHILLLMNPMMTIFYGPEPMISALRKILVILKYCD